MIGDVGIRVVQDRPAQPYDVSRDLGALVRIRPAPVRAAAADEA